LQIFFFFALIIAILAVIFAFQNNATATVSFAFWKYQGSLALVLLVALAAGALISFFLSLPSNLRTRWTVRTQRKKMTDLESKLAATQAQLDASQNKAIETVAEEKVEVPQNDGKGPE